MKTSRRRRLRTRAARPSTRSARHPRERRQHALFFRKKTQKRQQNKQKKEKTQQQQQHQKKKKKNEALVGESLRSCRPQIAQRGPCRGERPARAVAAARGERSARRHGGGLGRARDGGGRSSRRRKRDGRGGGDGRGRECAARAGALPRAGGGAECGSLARRAGQDGAEQRLARVGDLAAGRRQRRVYAACRFRDAPTVRFKADLDDGEFKRAALWLFQNTLDGLRLRLVYDTLSNTNENSKFLSVGCRRVCLRDADVDASVRWRRSDFCFGS